MDLVHGRARGIANDKSRDAPVTLLFDGTELVATGRKGGGLVAAALAGSGGASTGTIDREHFGAAIITL